MTATWCFLLLLFAAGESLEGRLLDISSPVTVNASTFYYDAKTRLQFAPQQAIQADTSRVWSSCFISDKETSPWFRLEFKSVISIFHVRLVVRTVGGGKIPFDFQLMGMNNLTVYVSNSSTLGSIDHDQQRCGDPWNYTSQSNIQINCGRKLTGLYLYVTVPSTSPTYLLICSIVLNRERGPSYPLNLSEDRATVISSGFTSTRPPELAIDGNSAISEKLCSSLSGPGTTWLRVDIQTVRYIREVRLLFYEGSGADAVYIGRSLRNNGASDNFGCGTIAKNTTGSEWQNLTCSLPVLGQYVYIQRKTNSMRICEIEVFYDNILSIYPSINVTASDQAGTTSAIWKVVDGVKGTSNYNSWLSLLSSNSWWRLELPRRSVISSVVIYTRPLDSRAKPAMNGFVVYVGDSVIGNGSMNAICGMPWKPPKGRVREITMECPNYPVGKYLYVAAAQRSNARLYLTDMEIYGCGGPIPITKTPSNQTIDYQSTASLRCTAFGCPYITIEWTGPNGSVSPSSLKSNIDTVTSTLNVTIGKAAQGGGQYMCTAPNAEGTDISGPVVLSVLVLPKIISPPMSVAIAGKSTAKLKCIAAGYPTVNVVWTDPQGNVAMANSTLHADNQVTSIVSIANDQGANGGGNYTCTPRNLANIGTSSYAVVTVKPDIVIHPSNGLTVKDGIDAGHLQCVTNAYPKPTITWKKNNIPISLSLMDLTYNVSNRFGRDLDVGMVFLSDGKTEYSCEVMQGSTVVTKSIILRVEPDAVLTSSPQSVVGVVGGDVIFSCGSSGRSVEVLQWTVDGTNISADGPKYSIVPNGKQSTLTVKQLELSDGTAEYRCIAGTAVKPNILASKSAMISVLGEITNFNDTAYDIGRNVDDSFSCLFTAHPQPNVSLQQDGKLVAGTIVQSKGSFMYIINLPSMAVIVSTAGLYECVVSYFGSSMKLSRTAQLQIFPTATLSPTTAITITSPTAVQLTCIAVGFPVPSVTWFHSRLFDVTNVTNLSSSDSDYVKRQTVSVLNYTNAYLDAGGEYKCVATNLLQKNEMPAIFTSPSTVVQVSPKVSVNSRQVDAVRGSSVHLRCTATGYPAPDFRWKFNDKLMAGEVTQKNTAISLSSLMLRSVTAISHGGVYKCEANNSAEPLDSATITVMFLPEVIIRPVSVGVGYLRDLTLTCTVSSYPAVNKVTWYRNSRQVSASSSAVVMKTISAVTSRLTMKSVTHEVACGNYSCYSMDSQTAVVTVGSEAFLDPSDRSVFEGDTFAIECRAVGCPPPSIFWQYRNDDSRNAIPVKAAVGVDIQSQVTSSSASKSILTFTNIRRLRTGMYRCHSDNGVVNIGYSKFTLINVYYVSMFLVSSDVTVDEEASFQLSCTPKGHPLLSVLSWRKVSLVNSADEQQVNGSQRVLFGISNASVVLNVTRSITADSGLYLCQFPAVSSYVRSETIRVEIRGRPAIVDAGTVKKQSIHARNFTLMWSKPFDGFSPILHYIIYYKEDGAANFTFLRNLNATLNTSTVSVTGLQPHTLYVVRIVPVNRRGRAASGYPVRVSTAVTYPSSPRNLKVTVTSSTSLFASWVKSETPNGPIDAYNVYFQIVDAVGGRAERSTVMSLQVTDVSVTSADITGLKKFTMYKVSVRAANKVITGSLEGPASNFVQIQTSQDVPSVPVSLSIAAVDDTSLRVTWLPPLAPNGIVQFYQVFIADSVKSVFHSGTQNISTDATETVIKGLTAYTTYTVIVRAFTIDFGNFSFPVDGLTDEGFPSAPQQLRVQSADATTVTLEWDPPVDRRGVIVNYVVHYRSMKTYVDTGGVQCQETIDKEIFTNKPTTSFTIPDLPADFTFNFNVVAVTGRGRGDASNEVQVNTVVGSPESPVAPNAGVDTPKTTSTLTLTLTKPSNRNGAIGSVLLFVALLTDNQVASEVDFANAVPMPYITESRTGTLIYVAAQFDYDNFPNTFVLGDNMMYGGYRNQPLIAGTRYAYALRSMSAEDSTLFTTSGAAEAVTLEGEGERSESSLPLVAAVVAVGLVVVFVQVFLFVLWKRYRRTRDASSYSVNKFQTNSGNMLAVGKNGRNTRNESDDDTMTSSSLYAQIKISEDDAMTSSSLYEQFKVGTCPEDTTHISFGRKEETDDHPYESIEMAATFSTSAEKGDVDRHNLGDHAYASIDNTKTSVM